jgi:drug/metabolite transporter (DMT)-like permease
MESAMPLPPVENRPFTPAAALAAIAVNAAFGANIVAVKMSLPGLGPFALGSIRLAAGAAIVAAVALATGRSLRLSARRAAEVAVYGLGFTLQVGLVYFAMTKTRASRGVLVAGVTPFLVLALAHFLIPGDRATPRKLVGLALGAAGVLVVLHGGAALGPEVREGDLLVLGAAALGAASTVYAKRIIGAFDPFAFAAYPAAIASPLLGIGALLWDPPATGALGPEVVGALLYQILVTASFGFVAWNALFRRHGAVALQSFQAIQPIVGVALGRLLLGEPLGEGAVLVALPLVALGIAVMNAEALRPPRRGR